VDSDRSLAARYLRASTKTADRVARRALVKASVRILYPNPPQRELFFVVRDALSSVCLRNDSQRSAKRLAASNVAFWQLDIPSGHFLVRNT
jgi:hypothetical protein